MRFFQIVSFCLKAVIVSLSFVFVDCSNLDDIDDIDDIAADREPVQYSISGVAPTRATLVTSSNLTEQFSDMVVKAVKDNNLVFTDSFNTTTLESKNKKCWEDESYVFYSYPSSLASDSSYSEERFKDNGLYFKYTVGTDSKSTPDYLLARTEVSYPDKVSFSYGHIFTAVNVVYGDVKAGHRITSIKLTGVYLSGKCKVGCTSSGDFFTNWSELSNQGVIEDEELKKAAKTATHDNEQLLGSDSKFMIIPNQNINIEIVVDGVNTIKAQCLAKGAGESVTFKLKDDWTLVQDNTGFGIESSVSNNTTMSISAWVKGERVRDKVPNTILLLDVSSSMADCSYTWAATKKSGAWSVTGLDESNGKTLGYYKICYYGNSRKYLGDVVYKKPNWIWYWRFIHYSGNEYTITAQIQSECKFYTKSSDVTKLSKLIEASNKIIDDIKAIGNTHYVSIVTYSNSGASIIAEPVDVCSGSNSVTLKSKISGLKASTTLGTTPGAGFEKVNSLLKENCTNSVFFITGGYISSAEDPKSPSSASNTYKNDVSSIISKAISNANTVKANASVYSVGIIDNTSTDADCFEQYYYLESYDDIKSYVASTSTDSSNSSYFLISNNTTNIKNLFSSAITEIEKKAWTERIFAQGIDSKAYVKAYISGAFKPLANGNTVKVYKVGQTDYKYSAYTWSSTKTDITKSLTCTFDATNQLLTVTGFDYSSNFCGEGRNNKGSKLLIEISGLERNPDKSGQNIANGYKSGLYKSDGTLVYEYSPMYVVF